VFWNFDLDAIDQKVRLQEVGESLELYCIIDFSRVALYLLHNLLHSRTHPHYISDTEGVYFN